MVYYMHRVYSRNGIAIRLTNGRWFHITNNHPELMGYYYEVLETLKEPEAIYAGNSGEYIVINTL